MFRRCKYYNFFKKILKIITYIIFSYLKNQESNYMLLDFFGKNIKKNSKSNVEKEEFLRRKNNSNLKKIRNKLLSNFKNL